MRKSSKVVISAAIAVALVGTGGAAFAWWSGTTVGAAGSGTAVTTTVAGNPVTVNQTNAPISTMSPGSSPSTLSGTFTNGGNTSAVVSNLAISFTVTQTTSGAAAGSCGPENYTVVQPVINPSQTIAANATGGSWSGTVAMNDLSSNQNGCVGATLNFGYTVS